MASWKAPVGNFSDDKLILKKYELKCQCLKNQIAEMLRIRRSFQILNLKNDRISKSLSKLKTEYELHLADLKKTLFNIKLAGDKQQILSKRKINEFTEKRKYCEEYLKTSPFKMELEELINKNNNLEEQWKKVIFLLELTKNQFKEIMNFLLKTFKMKVCEFCDTALKLKAVSH